jgi:hypothetical protein
MEQQLILVLAGIAISAGAFALGVWGYPKLKQEKQPVLPALGPQPQVDGGPGGYPLEAEVEAALLPVIYDGICAAYRVSEIGMDEVQRRLSGLDKKQIADSIYRMLPDELGGYDLTLIKRLVPAERFEQLVQDGFDRFDRFFIEHRAHFDQLFEQWKAEQG